MAREAGKTTTGKRKAWRKKWGNLGGYFFVAPLVLMWLIFGAYPYFRGLLIALQDYRLLDSQTWSPFNSFNGLHNFIEIVRDKAVWQGIKSSFFLYLSWFPFTTALSLFTAVMLNKVKTNWLASVYRVLMTLAWVIPLPAAMYMWGQIYEPNFGYLTYFLRDVLHIWHHPPAWTSDPFWYWPAIGLACSWKGFGYYMLLFLLGLYNIPKDLYDAARVDGANGWQQFRYVELPGIRNIMLLFLVTNVGFLGAGTVEMMSFGAGPGGIYKTLALYSWDVSFTGATRMGYGAALALFGGLINLSLVTIVFKSLRSEKA